MCSSFGTSSAQRNAIFHMHSSLMLMRRHTAFDAAEGWRFGPPPASVPGTPFFCVVLQQCLCDSRLCQEMSGRKRAPIGASATASAASNESSPRWRPPHRRPCWYVARRGEGCTALTTHQPRPPAPATAGKCVCRSPRTASRSCATGCQA